MNKMNMADKIAFWALIVAIIAIIIGVTTPEVRCLLRLQSESCTKTIINKPNGYTPSPQQSTNDSNNGSPPSSNIPFSRNWENIHDYFKIEEKPFEKGFQKEPSKLSFIVEAKDNFKGKMYAYLYDKDGIKVCDVGLDCSSIGSKHYVYFPKRSFSSLSSLSNDSDYWKINERDIGFLSIPNNVSKVEFNFDQSKY